MPYRGYMKGTAIAYLARERDNAGMEDIDYSWYLAKAEQILVDVGK